jgi:hypothetical protein
MEEGSKMTKEERDKELKPYNAVIQICPRCGKIDVSLGDKHECDFEYQEYLRESQDHGQNGV